MKEPEMGRSEATPEIVRILNVIKKDEEIIARGNAPMAIHRHLALAKCTYWRMRKLRIV